MIQDYRKRTIIGEKKNLLIEHIYPGRMENDERAGSEKEKNKDLIYFDRSGKTDWKQKLKGCQ